MSIGRRNILGGAGFLALVVGAGLPAVAQSTCVTPDCVYYGVPAVCQNREQAGIPTVLMTQSGVNFVFVPANPKIEPGGCILWKAASATHSSSANGCSDDSLCGSPAPAACKWDSGNVSSLDEVPSSTCFYSPAAYPAGTGEGYYCRIHATPTTGSMRGTLRVTTPIVLMVNKDLGANSVKLSWTGGGVTGDVTYKVARNTGGDPLMPTATTTTVNPDGGVTGTVFTDSGDLGNPTTRYYIIRNKQTNEP